ncbi:DUF6660 family protein [Constantimarinum furrinae]|nr:DUF6660 family protein [Constantimarinum furrinae]
MKAVTLIFALFMLLLSFKPCSDGFSADHNEDPIAIEDHDHSEDSDDSCPAVCFCNCCGTSVTFELLEQFLPKNPLQIISIPVSDYISLYSFNYLNSIWHPPQFVS